MAKEVCNSTYTVSVWGHSYGEVHGKEKFGAGDVAQW
jgi:hypothetical protein